MSKNITLAMAVAGIRKIVNTFGAGHHAKAEDGGIGCTYFAKDESDGSLTPICIVGQYLHNLGALAAVVSSHQYGEQYGACSYGSAIWTNLAAMGLVVDEDAQAFLRNAQERQDAGKSWGEAYNVARERAYEIVAEQRREQQRREDAEFGSVFGEPFDLSDVEDDDYL